MQIAIEMQQRWGIAVDRTLSLSLGVGLTFVLFGVTEVAGRLKWLHDNTPQILEYEYRQAMKDWNTDMLKRWKTSAVYLELMGEKEIRRQQVRYDLQNANVGRRSVLKAQREAEIASLQMPVPQFGSVPNHRRNGNTKTSLIKVYLTEKAKEGNFPEIKEIQGWLSEAHGMTAAKSTVSDARAAWQREYDPHR